MRTIESNQDQQKSNNIQYVVLLSLNVIPCNQIENYISITVVK